MSLVEIIEHNEVIYTILDKPLKSPPPTPRYHSQLEKELRATKKPQMQRTFGYPKRHVAEPEKFLRKGRGFHQPVKKCDHVHFSRGDLPPVPKRPPPGQKGPERPKVNFRLKNIMKAVKTKAKPPEPRLVDTRDGHIKKIKGSGEVPEYCKQPGFGKMPGYLLRRNYRIKRELTRLQLEEENRESLCKLVSKEERDKLLLNLKQNWAAMQKAFLQLPMLTDTVPKINQKQALERELLQIEKDIALVEENPNIYVYDANAS